MTLLPDLKRQYNFEKNTAIDPTALRIGDQTTYCWWKCPDCGYEWNSTVTSRLDRIDGKIIVRHCQMCFTKGLDKITPVATVDKLMKYWDFEKNTAIGLDPNTISAYSPEPAYWWCRKCGYKWPAQIRNRSAISDGCPFCDAHKVIIPGQNDILTLFPEFTDLFDVKSDAPLDLSTCGLSCNQDVHFRCKKCDYEWDSKLCGRFGTDVLGNKYLRDCPSCRDRSMRRIPYSLEYPELVPLFSSEHNECTLDDITVGQSRTRLFYWICPDCHKDFTAHLFTVIDYIKNGTPICYHCSEDCKIDESFANQYPEYLSFHSNPDIDPHTVTPKSGLITVWKCEYGHEWDDSFREIAQTGPVCDICSGTKIVKGVNTFADHYPEHLPMFSPNNDFKPDEIFYKSRRWFKWICNICNGEYGGYIHEIINGKECPYCSERLPLPGFNTLAVKYPDIAALWSVENELTADEVVVNTNLAKWNCSVCNGTYNARIIDIVNGDDDCPYCNDRMILPGYNTLAAKYPDIATLWSDQNELTADEVRPNHRSGAWTCPTCHNDYNAEIIDMVNGDADCPYCNDRMVAPGYNTLAAKFPDIAALWSDKNELSADEVLPNTNFADWDCPDCHMTFHARIIDMVNGNDNCPYCSGRKAIPGKTSFAALHPDLIEEWDYIANYCLIDPDEITDSCTKKVWWICQKNPRHHYLLSPSEKLLYQKRHRESCLYCKGRRRKKTYF